MRDLDLLVPSALVDPALAPDLLHGVSMPGLSRVLAYADPPETTAWPAHGALTSWQAWVFATRAGVEAGRVNIAELWAMACGVAPGRDGGRWLAEPAHFTIAKDHLRLADPRGLAVTLAEARALAATIEPVLADAGWHLEPIEPATLTHWLLTRRDGLAVSGAALDRAIGENVAAWQPRAPSGQESPEGGDDAVALAWRACVNEIQMLWFGHPVNDAREAAGQDAINTLWLSGNGAPPTDLPHYAAVDSGLPLLAALPVEPDAPRVLEGFDRLIAPAASEDWSTWRDELERLDARIGQLLHDQQAGKLGAVTLAFCGHDRVSAVTLRPRAARRFWRGWGASPSLADWFADEAASR